MRPQIKKLHTPDAPSLTSFAPEHADDFALIVQIIVGPEGEEGEESFDLEVATPKELARRVEHSGPQLGRHLLIVNHFNPDRVRSWIEKAVAACSGDDWEQLAAQLARIGRWEFEDYSE